MSKLVGFQKLEDEVKNTNHFDDGLEALENRRCCSVEILGRRFIE
jgi:hypothetical protein